MKEIVWLLVGEHDEVTRWVARSDNGAYADGAAAAPDLIPQAKRYELILASELTTFTSVTLPAKGRELYLKTLATQVEERTLLPLDHIHAVPGSVEDDGRCLVTIIDASALRETIGRFARYQITFDAIGSMTELFARSTIPPSATLLPDATLYVPADGPPLLLDRSDEGPSNLLSEDEEITLQNDWRWEQAVGRHTVTDLMTGPFAPPPAWKRGALALTGSLPLLTLLLFILTLSLGAQWWGLEREKVALKAHMKETVTSTFPKVTVVVDPLFQMRQELERLQIENRDSRPSAAMFATLTAVARQAASVDAPLVGLRYEEERFSASVVHDNPSVVVSMRSSVAGAAPTVDRRNDGTTTLIWRLAGEERR